VPLQRVVPVGQTHLPLVHEAPAGQAAPHLPQLAALVCRLTQAPLQTTCPVGQAQLPFTQLPAEGQTTPHLPQLPGSICGLTQVPPQQSWPLAQGGEHGLVGAVPVAARAAASKPREKTIALPRPAPSRRSASRRESPAATSRARASKSKGAASARPPPSLRGVPGRPRRPRPRSIPASACPNSRSRRFMVISFQPSVPTAHPARCKSPPTGPHPATRCPGTPSQGFISKRMLAVRRHAALECCRMLPLSRRPERAASAVSPTGKCLESCPVSLLLVLLLERLSSTSTSRRTANCLL
jgi:hypothetical protein